jgi:predicted RND superfamily exporter protein
MTLLFGSLRVGLLSVLPNLLPVAMGVAIVWMSLSQVDADTMIYLTICIGIAVDDTIHFLSRYRLERRRGLEREAAVRAAIL